MRYEKPTVKAVGNAQALVLSMLKEGTTELDNNSKYTSISAYEADE
jgi:hypothetical protein